MSQALELREGSSTPPVEKFDWNMWGLKWSAILLGGCVLVAAPFVIKAYKTKQPGTRWAVQR